MISSSVRTFVLFSCILPLLSASERKVSWPTADYAFLLGKPLKEFIQPTASKKLESGLYGNTRNNGMRFHEGIDIKASKRDAHGRASDKIFSILPGRVVYINQDPSNSSYGKYIVLVHDSEDVPVYSLYAHLRTIDSGISVGYLVESGVVLGIMGRTAGNYRIPESRAHLHFEIGLRLTDNFQLWYDRQDYGDDDPNHHGNWNGMNLFGSDPLRFYKEVLKGKKFSMSEYINALPTAVTVQIDTDIIPNFATRYPHLLTQSLKGNVIGWEISFTEYGFPQSLTPLKGGAFDGKFETSIVHCEKSLLGKRSGRNLIQSTNRGLKLGKDLKQILELMFGVKL